MQHFTKLTTFCGSTLGKTPVYEAETIKLARILAEKGIVLVYGGGNRGLMGRLADNVRQNGGRVIGVLPRQMDKPEVRTKKVEDELIIVDGMHQRKEKMYELGDGFIALPGGIGTLEELMEIYTWQELGYHHKPIGLLNINGYYDLLLEFLHHATEEGFFRKEYLSALIVQSDPERLLEEMERATIALPDKLTTT